MESYPEQSPQRDSSSKVWIFVIGGLALACLCGIGVVGLSGAGLYLMRSTDTVDANVPLEELTVEAFPLTAVPGDEIDEEPQPGESPEVEEIDPGGVQHEELGTEIEYSSDPPVGGNHYEVWVEPGLYEEVVEDGYLVHNLEHGYVIIWYNCDDLSSAQCDTLKNDIQSVIDYFDGYKVIGMPRSGMPTVLALTSWGRLARLNAFDFNLIVEFIEQYQEQSPEPNAP
jgi:hypothetical protein